MSRKVASVSFHENQCLSVDIEHVIGIEMGSPIEVGPDQWFAEVIIRSPNGNLSVQMIADNPERFHIEVPETAMPE